MADTPLQDETDPLGARLEQLGRTLGARETSHAEGMQRARQHLGAIRGRVEAALRRFHAGTSESGAAHLRIDLSPIRVDEKHLRAVEFDLSRGRHKAIVVAKSRGEVTLVGPFRSGKAEGPCKSIAFDAPDALDAALGEFLASFLEEAASP